MGLLDELRAAGLLVDDSSRRRSEYAYDASSYRVRPLAVVFPRSADEVRAAVVGCAEHGVPVVCRGGGTSMAGNAVGDGVVLDLSRHMDTIGSIDAEARTVDVGPGVVLAVLSRAVQQASGGTLTFAPDPSSRTRATIGGAVGNDACGNHSVRHGRTSDHLVELDLLTPDGALLTAARGGLRATRSDDAASARRADELNRALTDLAADHLAELRTELGTIPRQVSGYHLQHLLPESGFDVARALAGSEGSCAIVVGARMQLVPQPPAAILVCVGYADIVAAARDVPTLLATDPAAVEAIDGEIVATMRWRRGDGSLAGLPEGEAFVFVDLDGEDPAEVLDRARRLAEALATDGRAVDARVVDDPIQRAQLWRVREDGAGLTARLRPAPDGTPGPESWPGWEDSAVAPERLADYLQDLAALLDEHGLSGVMYGHFGAGCVHIRVTYDLRSPEGIRQFREFTEAAARLVVRHGGSLSGEHGDGRARSELLPLMYSPRIMEAFARFRRVWDPAGVLSGVGVADPAPMDAHLALDGVPHRAWSASLSWPEAGDVDSFAYATQACIGVGRCRSHSGGVMCPSYRATRDEKDSTRGRARVLQEMIRTAPTVQEGWASADVKDALDLCLSCKACSSDCPTGVDMASMKSEFLHQHYRGRLRPPSHYLLGRLPMWLDLATRVPALANAALGLPFAGPLMRLVGITSRRRFPALAHRDDWARAAAAAGAHRPGSGDGDVVLFVDTFTRAFRPQVAGAAAAVARGAGQVVECAEEVCCGLPWVSTGQLDGARARLRSAVESLDDGTERPIVVTEPSCAATLHHDLPRLVDGAAARRVAGRVQGFAGYAAGLVTSDALAPPSAPLPEHPVLQVHCHEHATFGETAQTAVLAALGVDPVPATGCCGVAGNFGFEAEHVDVSLAVAETALVPALARSDDTEVLTDGFSCAMQVAHVAPDRHPRHLAELLDPRPRKDEP